MKSPQFFSAAARRRQHGQALVFGIFLLLAGLVTMFYMFNTGQVTQEKSKLVNTADAVAYSAGLMEARALNFDAYANRAMIANEVGIAQIVSITSWIRYAGEVAENVPKEYGSYCNEPGPTWYPWFGKSMPLTFVLCYMMDYAGDIVTEVADVVSEDIEPAFMAVEAVKMALQAGQGIVHGAAFTAARRDLMSRVADANYQNDGVVKVDQLLVDNFSDFTHKYVKHGAGGEERGRLGDLARAAAYNDDFVEKRSWTDRSIPPLCADLSSIDNPDFLKRRGGTELLNYDEWKAMDTMSHHRVYLRKRRFAPAQCRYREAALGYGTQAAADEKQSGGNFGNSIRHNPQASDEATSDDWNYSGIPEFRDLSEAALGEDDPKLRLTVRLTRDRDQTRTTETASQIKAGGRLAIYRANHANDVLAAISSAEIFFDRPEPRAGNPPLKELASLFNPFWHVHLTTPNADEKRMAASLQGAQFIPD